MPRPRIFFLEYWIMESNKQNIEIPNAEVETRPIHGGIQHAYQFPNGYGASVVRHSFSYGGSLGLWELAVIHNGELCYDTPITNDVLGNLSWDEAMELVKEIGKFKKKPWQQPKESIG